MKRTKQVQDKQGFSGLLGLSRAVEYVSSLNPVPSSHLILWNLGLLLSRLSAKGPQRLLRCASRCTGAREKRVMPLKLEENHVRLPTKFD